jgi:hypothetical protein
MVVIIDMNNGERIFVQDSKQENSLSLPMETNFVCPGSQAQPVVRDELQVMPALMEHTFNTR